MVNYERFGQGLDGERIWGGFLAQSRLDLTSTFTVNSLKKPAKDRFTEEIHRLPESRRQLIFSIRRQLAEGTYNEESKFEVALDLMVDRVALQTKPGLHFGE